ncbi:unnamed protein product [Phaedon cochleariae]|uniref:RING-type E3 ubiquitin transferase n=1 Tax=Phaedon cochleariae TaxID=80249 RepID=A0A9N9X2B2_PHACE|nr:unnamed protein product [Phaedon cochleariae]
MTTKQQKITKTISSDPPKVRDYNTLIFSDVLCPICRSIMIEPVSLPCNHHFCLCCFDDTMKTANRVCPLCQVRVGSWWRKAQINGKHINVKFQKAINERYSQQILNKLTGIEEDFKESKMVKENGIQKKSLTGIEEDFKEPKMVEENGIQKKSDHVEIVEDTADSVSVKREINDQVAFKREKLLFNEQVGEKQTAEISSTPPPSMKDKITVETHEITSPMVEPKIEPNDSFSNKQFICRIFPLDQKNRYKRTDFYSPLSISALEIKTREQLRKKKEREDYQKGLEAEKLRLKELYDKSLASKTLFSWPPPKIPLRKSTDKFQQREAPLEAEYSESKFNFATKSYSSRELILNRNVNGENMGESSATIRPKIRHIEKIVEIKGGKLKKNRYSNKPIDHRMNLSSQGNSRIKIKMFPKKTHRNPASKMLSSESTKFSSTSSSKNQFSLKRSISEENSDCSFHGFDNISVEDEQKVIKKFEDNFSSNGLFYGFYNNSSVGNNKRITITNCKREENEFEKKPSQEELDLEFARTLQKNLDRAYNTRPSKTLRIYT